MQKWYVKIKIIEKRKGIDLLRREFKTGGPGGTAPGAAEGTCMDLLNQD